MYDWYWSLVVKVVHAHGYLLGPEQNLMKVNGVQSQVVVQSTGFSIFWTWSKVGRGGNIVEIHMLGVRLQNLVVISQRYYF